MKVDYKCGISHYQQVQGRIVGGKAVLPHTLPWVVSLSGGTVICSGTLISRHNVLSAAHCGSSFKFAVLGDHNRDVADGEKHYRITQNGWHQQPRAKKLGNSDVWLYDIAIAELEDRVEFTQTIQPACLPRRAHENFDNTHAYVAGWGNLKFKGEASSTLMSVNVTVIPQTYCELAWDKYWGAPSPSNLTLGRYHEDAMICAGDQKNWDKDACHGDSGGIH